MDKMEMEGNICLLLCTKYYYHTVSRKFKCEIPIKTPLISFAKTIIMAMTIIAIAVMMTTICLFVSLNIQLC